MGALGFRKNMILKAFLLELSFVAVLGILLRFPWSEGVASLVSFAPTKQTDAQRLGGEVRKGAGRPEGPNRDRGGPRRADNATSMRARERGRRP